MMRRQITWYWLNGQNSSPILFKKLGRTKYINNYAYEINNHIE